LSHWDAARSAPWCPSGRAPAARRPEGQAIRGRVPALGQRAMRLVTERAWARGRPGPRSRLAGRETPLGEVQRHRIADDVFGSGQPRGSRRCPGRRGSGTSSSSFRGRVSTGRGSARVSRSGPETRSCSPSVRVSQATLKLPSLRARSAAVALEGAPHRARCSSCSTLAKVCGLALRTRLLLIHLVAWARS